MKGDRDTLYIGTSSFIDAKQNFSLWLAPPGYYYNGTLGKWVMKRRLARYNWITEEALILIEHGKIEFIWYQRNSWR